MNLNLLLTLLVSGLTNEVGKLNTGGIINVAALQADLLAVVNKHVSGNTVTK